MGIQVCPMPTALLSTHTTGFTDFSFLDLSGEMRRFLDHWEALDLRFDAVYSGFLGCAAQMEFVAECIERCLLPGGLAVVDPVMGDNGRLDPTITHEMVERMRWLVGKAYCITPNYSEACWLLNKTYAPESSTECIRDWLACLTEMGPELAVITSVPIAARPQDSSVVGYHRGLRRFWKVDYPYIPAYYPGTGDMFTSVLTGSLLQGDSPQSAMNRAVHFVTQSIRATLGHAEPNHYGILFERVLETLRSPVSCVGYELRTEEG